MEKVQNLITECRRCNANEKIAPFLTYEKPASFWRSDSPLVMIIGHSPTVRTAEEAEVVLKMDKPGQPLYKYISSSILDPLGIGIGDIYCTNLVKCNTKCLPEDIPKHIRFFNHAFANCRALLEEEIKAIQPKLIISLSETVLSMLSCAYYDHALKMKESFAKLHRIEVTGARYSYIPLVHIPKGPNSKVAQHYFPEQTNRLRLIRNELLG